MRKTAFFLLGVLGLFGSLSAGRFEIGLGGGFFTHGSGSGAVLGITPGFRIARSISLETEYYYYPSALQNSGSLSDFGLTLLVGPGPWEKRRGDPDLGENRKIAPYLALGVNLFRETSELESSLEGPFLAIGGGLKYRLSPRASLSFDVRYFLQLLEDEYPSPEKNSLRVTAGVSFRL